MSTDSPKIAALSRESAMIISVLNLGLAGDHGTVAVRASKRGLSISMGGRMIASGRTAEKCIQELTGVREKANAARPV